MRSACACMIGRKRSRAAGSSRAEPRSVSMKPDSAASGVRSSWLALATKSARISSTRRSGVRSWNASSTRPGLAATPGDEIGVTITSYQRSSGTRSENSTRCAVPLARARRIASSTSGTRRPSETGSPGRSAGATAVARALSATTSPRRSSATTGSGRPASTASIKGSPTRGARGSTRASAAGATSPRALAISAAAATSTKPASAGSAAVAPNSHRQANAIAAAASTRRMRLKRSTQRLTRTLS